MNATRLKGRISTDRRLIVDDLPMDVMPGVVEVIVLQETASESAKRTRRHGTKHPAFGIWAERTDIASATAFSTKLRRRITARSDARGE